MSKDKDSSNSSLFGNKVVGGRTNKSMKGEEVLSEVSGLVTELTKLVKKSAGKGTTTGVDDHLQKQIRDAMPVIFSP